MPKKWWVLASIACGTFMATLDSSVVNIALPTLTKALGTDLYKIKWVVIAYLLVITCLVLPVGRLSDQYGRKKVFQLGFLVFVAGSAFCGLSANLPLMLLARMIQGAGAAMLMANGPAILTASFPAAERGKALGTMAMVVSAGLVSGPSMGGFLITELGWRSIFLINIPVGLFGVLMVYLHVSRDPHHRIPAPFDWPGALLQTIILLGFIVLVDPPSVSVSGSSPFEISRILLLCGVCAFGLLFVRIELDAHTPLFDLSLLGSRVFWTANLASFLMFLSYSALVVLMPFFLEEVLHLTPDKAGLYMSAIPLTIFVVAPISGRLSDRLGSQGLSSIGAALCAIVMFAMAGSLGPGLSDVSTPFEVLLGLSLLGLATGLFQSPNNSAIMGSVPHAKLGAASALLATVRNLGMVTGTGLSTGLFLWRKELSGDFVLSLHFVLATVAFVAVGAMLASLGRGRRT